MQKKVVSIIRSLSVALVGWISAFIKHFLPTSRKASKKEYAVFHSLDPMTMLYPDGNRWMPRTEHYRHVATVLAEDLDEVFSLTNDHWEETAWTDLPQIKWSRGRAIRSTSMGDVIHDLTEWRTFLILGTGFQELSQPESCCDLYYWLIPGPLFNGLDSSEENEDFARFRDEAEKGWLEAFRANLNQSISEEVYGLALRKKIRKGLALYISDPTIERLEELANLFGQCLVFENPGYHCEEYRLFTAEVMNVFHRLNSLLVSSTLSGWQQT
jgi:hypothetical protein